MKILEKLFCQRPLEEVNTLKKELKTLTDYKDNLLEDNNELAKLVVDETPTAKAWNNKWPKNKLLYRAQDSLKRDVRNLIFTKSYLLEPEAAKLRKRAHDDTAMSVLKKVIKHVKYTDDKNTHNQPEFWQNPEETWQTRKGDCEDSALLIISLARIAKVPAYRIKLCAGWVNLNNKLIGHAYAIYLADDGKWYVLDGSYWPSDSIRYFKTLPHNKQITRYKDIWWTCNDKYSWAQKDTVL